jgi:hypothetical protein
MMATPSVGMSPAAADHVLGRDPIATVPARHRRTGDAVSQMSPAGAAGAVPEPA